MSDRKTEILDKFSKHLRLLQFTLVITCISFLTIILSDRQTIIKIANQQINDIYNYTSVRNWDENRIQKQLDESPDNKPILSKSINLDPNETEYILCLDHECSDPIPFSLVYHGRFFHEIGGDDGAIDLDGSISRPETLAEFKAFYDGVSSGCCIYSIEGVKGDFIYVNKGYELYDPNDSMVHESSISLDKVSIKIADKANLRNLRSNADNKSYSAALATTLEEPFLFGELEGLSLVISWIYKDKKGIYIEFEYYKIPLITKEHRYDRVAILNRSSWHYNYYDEQFKALKEITEDWDHLDIPTAKKIINSEYARRGGSFKVIGIELPADLMLSWGIYLILGIQFYFFLHLREFFRREELFRKVQANDVFPWLLLYRDTSVVLVYYFSVVVLPLVAAVVVVCVNFSIHPFKDFFRYIQVVIAGLLILTTAFHLVKQQLRIRRAVQMFRDG